MIARETGPLSPYFPLTRVVALEPYPLQGVPRDRIGPLLPAVPSSEVVTRTQPRDDFVGGDIVLASRAAVNKRSRRIPIRTRRRTGVHGEIAAGSVAHDEASAKRPAEGSVVRDDFSSYDSDGRAACRAPACRAGGPLGRRPAAAGGDPGSACRSYIAAARSCSKTAIWM